MKEGPTGRSQQWLRGKKKKLQPLAFWGPFSSLSCRTFPRCAYAPTYHLPNLLPDYPSVCERAYAYVFRSFRRVSAATTQQPKTWIASKRTMHVHVRYVRLNRAHFIIGSPSTSSSRSLPHRARGNVPSLGRTILNGIKLQTNVVIVS